MDSTPDDAKAAQAVDDNTAKAVDDNLSLQESTGVSEDKEGKHSKAERTPQARRWVELLRKLLR